MLSQLVVSNLFDPMVTLSVGFSSQEYWSGLPYPPPMDLPEPGVKPGSLWVSLSTFLDKLVKNEVKGSVKDINTQKLI